MRALPFVIAALVVAAILATGTGLLAEEPAAPPAKEFFPQPTEREARLEGALDQPLSISFSETPLSDVAAWFSSKLEVPVILDHRSLEDAGISSQTPVTRRVDGVSARAGLGLVLDDLDLARVQRDGVLVIMTQDKAESQLVARVYPAGDLTPLVPRPVPPAQKAGMRPGSGMFQVEDDAKTPSPADAPAEEPKQPPAKVESRMIADYAALIEVITTTVKPQTWGEVGGPGSISPMSSAQSLVISQTREVHDEILELLRALRAAKLAGAVVAPAEN